MRTSAGTFFKGGPARVLALLVLSAVLAACSSGYYGMRRAYPPSAPRYEGQLIASWYGPGFHGKLTASGERYDQNAMTSAHRTFPLGTRVKVTNLTNNRSVYVTVNDRGPFVKNRAIDLSYAAAKKIGMIGPGTAPVRIERLGRDMKYVKYIKSELPGEKGPFTVQVGSYGDRYNALRMMKGIKIKYKRAYIFQTGHQGRQLYRVRVGKFKARQDAEDYARGIAGDGYTSMVVPYEEQI